MSGFKTRFNPSSFLLTDAALVHPDHKSLSWLEPTRREEAIQQFKDELLTPQKKKYSFHSAASIRHPPNSLSSLDIQEDVAPNQSALDAFFDFDVSQCNFLLVQFQLHSAAVMYCYQRDPWGGKQEREGLHRRRVQALYAGTTNQLAR